jgi:hypothetical protein
MAISNPDRTRAPAPVSAPTLDALVQQIGVLAQKMGVPAIIIIGRDPRTSGVKLYGDPSLNEDQDFREIVAAKFKLFDSGETAWPD